MLAVLGTGTVAAGCDPPDEPLAEQPLHTPQVLPSDALTSDAPRDALQFLNPQQARTVDALAARIIPGDAADPGAREAGVLYYIDHLLATHAGYAETTYTDGPFPEGYEGDEPPAEDDEVVWVPQGQLERYGWQSPFVPREIYQMGLARLDALARARFDGDAADLPDDQLDELIGALEDDEDDDVAEVFGDLSATSFFEMLRTHTLEGFLGDPVYGGNRGMVGWQLIGFPGERRAYTPEDMHDERFVDRVEPQSLIDLPPFHPHEEDRQGNALITVRKRPPNGPID